MKIKVKIDETINATIVYYDDMDILDMTMT